MAGDYVSQMRLDRRRWLKLSVAPAVAASLPSALVGAQSSFGSNFRTTFVPNSSSI